MDPVEALEECLVTILIGLSRHSRACADAVMKCPRLVQTIANRFAKKVTVEAHPSMIKSVILLKVGIQSSLICNRMDDTNTYFNDKSCID